MSEFLNFSEISQKIPFKDVLDWLNIPYSITQKGELKGEHFIITPSKNLYLNLSGDDKGSVINFLAKHKGIDVRSAAAELKAQFLTTPKEPKRELPTPELHYCKFLEDKGISEDLAKELEVGMVKQKSIMSGKLAFKTYDEEGKHNGYVGYNIKEDKWLFPNNYRRCLYNPKKIQSGDVILTVDLFTCLQLIARDNPAVCLIGRTMTETQEKQLACFDKILLVHSDPDNIIVRLSKNSFVKASL